MRRVIGLMSWVFANGPGERGSIPSRVKPKIQKMVLDAGLLSTQRYKVRVKWRNPVNEVVPSHTSRLVAIEKGAFVSLSTEVANFYFI